MISGGNDTYFGAVRQFNGITCAGNGPVGYFYANQFPLYSPGLLGDQGILAYEFILVQLAEHRESCHYGRYVRAEFVSVERETGLEAEGIPATEPARDHAGSKEGLPKIHYGIGSGLDLESVLSGVAGWADYGTLAIELGIYEMIEHKAGKIHA